MRRSTVVEDGTQPMAAAQSARPWAPLARASLRILLPAAVALVAAVAWQVYAGLQGNFLIPTTVQIVGAIPRLLTDPKVWAGLLESGTTMLAGFALAAVSGVPVGFLMGRAPRLDRIIQPYLDIALVMPMVVVMPIVMIAIGITRQAEVLVVWLFAVPYIIATTRAGVREVDPIFGEMACSFGASERQIWREVLVPGAAPAIFTALVFGFGMALTGIIVTELSLIALGIGQLLLSYQGQFDSANVFGLVVIIAVMATVLMTVLRRLEKRVVGASGTSLRSTP